MSTSVNPVLALVPGAFHSPVHYAKLIQLLEEAGYETATRQNPSTGSTDATTADVHADVEAIREMVLLPQLNAGKDIVLVAHSYGGCPAGAAAEGLSKAKRSAAGQSGGIIGIIFIAAFIAQEGESLISKLPGQVLEPWHKLDEASSQLSVIDPKTILYADVLAPADQTAISQLKNQSLISFKTGASTPAWKDPYYDGRRSYCSTLQDRAILPIAQEMMIKGSGVGWTVKSIEASHSPFLSHPEELSEWIVQQATGFASA